MNDEEIKAANSRTFINKSKVDVTLPSASEDEDFDDDLQKLPPECCEGFHGVPHLDGDPTRHNMSVPWFQKIHLRPQEYKHLCFSESLMMVDEIGKIAGKMYTSVTAGKWGDQACLCVHSGSFGKLDNGLECGTTITGFVSFNMKPLQDYVYEWVSSEGKITERKTFVMKEDSAMHVRILHIKSGEIVEQKDVNVGRFDQQLLVTESSNIVLQRLMLMEKRTTGGMDLKTLTFQGKVVNCKYVELGNGWENVKGEAVRAWSIRRRVEFDFGDRLWDSVYNQFGRLILRCQPESTHALIPLWYEPVKEYKDGKFVGTYPIYIWACDAELHAKYLLKKDELADEHRSYLLEHPELRALLSDFLQTVMLRKPPHLIPFTQQYFESFLRFRPGTDHISAVDSGSSTMSSVEDEEWGEWEGEGSSDHKLYNMKPTITDDGLEKIYDHEEELMDKILHNEENLTIGAEGKLITNFETTSKKTSDTSDPD